MKIVTYFKVHPTPHVYDGVNDSVNNCSSIFSYFVTASSSYLLKNLIQVRLSDVKPSNLILNNIKIRSRAVVQNYVYPLPSSRDEFMINAPASEPHIGVE